MISQLVSPIWAAGLMPSRLDFFRGTLHSRQLVTRPSLVDLHAPPRVMHTPVLNMVCGPPDFLVILVT